MLAVNMPPQAPEPGHALHSICEPVRTNNKEDLEVNLVQLLDVNATRLVSSVGMK